MDRLSDPIDAYVVYNKTDEAWAKELAVRIELERIGERTLKVFFAPWDIEEGKNFVLTLNHGLQTASFVLIVLTPEAVASEWVQREWSSALLKDVSGSAGRIIPLLRRTCDVPLFLRVLDYVDFRNPLEFENSVSELLRRLKDERKPRGGIASSSGNAIHVPLRGALLNATRPDQTHERLESNLYPVLEHPTSWFRIPSPADTLKDLRDMIGPAKASLPALLIREKHILTFDDPRSPGNPLHSAMDLRLTQEESIQDAIADPMRRAWFVELLKKCLLVELSHRGVAHDKDHDRFFFMKPREGIERKEAWQSPKKLAKRIVARTRESDGVLLRWEHFAAYMRFIEVEHQFVLVVEPTWTFTRDGREPLASDRVTRLALRKTYRDNNAEVLNDTRFWIMYLAQNHDQVRLRTSGRPIRIATQPLAIELDAGLAWDLVVPDIVSNPPEPWDEGQLEARDVMEADP